jgi:hypothetical protein
MSLHDEVVHAGAKVVHVSSGRKNLLEQMYAGVQKVVASGADEFLFKIPALTADVTVANATTARKVRVQVTDALGNVHKWFNQTITVSMAKSSSAGTVTNTTTLKIVNGEGVYDIAAPGGTWLAGDTQTFTVTQQTILGMTVLAVANVVTIVANP